MTLDTEIFHTNAPLRWLQYMCVCVDEMPGDVIPNYNLQGKEMPDHYIYVEV